MDNKTQNQVTIPFFKSNKPKDLVIVEGYYKDAPYMQTSINQGISCFCTNICKDKPSMIQQISSRSGAFSIVDIETYEEIIKQQIKGHDSSKKDQTDDDILYDVLFYIDSFYLENFVGDIDISLKIDDLCNIDKNIIKDNGKDIIEKKDLCEYLNLSDDLSFNKNIIINSNSIATIIDINSYKDIILRKNRKKKISHILNK